MEAMAGAATEAVVTEAVWTEAGRRRVVEGGGGGGAEEMEVEEALAEARHRRSGACTVLGARCSAPPVFGDRSAAANSVRRPEPGWLKH